MSEKVDNKTNASVPGPFSNPITLGVLVIVILLIGFAVFLAFQKTLKTTFWATVLGGIGAVIWVYGEKEHKSSNPRQAGVLIFWDSIINFAGIDYFVVSGTVILANYPPFYLDTIVVDIENKEDKFNFTVLTEDKIVMECTLFVTTHANVDDLRDFIQAGNDMKKVFEQVASIGSKAASDICKGMKAEDVYYKRSEISTQLQDKLRDVFETRDFGIVIVKANLEAILPELLRTTMQKITLETYEKPRELKNSDTWNAVAKRTMRQSALVYLPAKFSDDGDNILESEWNAELQKLVEAKKIKTFDEYYDQVKIQRLIDANRVTRIESPGNSVNINSVKIDQP